MDAGTRDNTQRIATRIARRRPRPAFSFVEVLFAVMILGVGFIMLAGIFPVAISQTQTTGEENNAANIGRSAVAQLQKLEGTIAPQAMNPDGEVHRFDMTPIVIPNQPSPPLWERVRGNLIQTEDPRYAWVPLYRRWLRPNPTPPPGTIENDFAEVIVFVVRVRNKTEYVPQMAPGSGGDLELDSNGRGTLMPVEVTVTLREKAPDPDQIEITGPMPHPVVPGTFVVIAAGTDVAMRPAAGRIYRVGNAVTEGNRNLYLLAPSNDMAKLPGPSGPLLEDVTNVRAWVIGEGLDATGAYSGGAQDVSIYSSFIKLNP